MAVPTGANEQTNPTVDSPEVLTEARAHWADHCATCHANNGSGETEMGKHLYPPAPDMRGTDTQSLSDGELFYIIQNGIRLTGMPAWGSGSEHDNQDSWKLVRFIRHLPKLTAEEDAEMKEMNPKSPDELKEEQEEREFLNGDQSHEHAQHEHH
jgi:mono/diheme cytochrome c family protein